MISGRPYGHKGERAFPGGRGSECKGPGAGTTRGLRAGREAGRGVLGVHLSSRQRTVLAGAARRVQFVMRTVKPHAYLPLTQERRCLTGGDRQWRRAPERE